MRECLLGVVRLFISSIQAALGVLARWPDLELSAPRKSVASMNDESILVFRSDRSTPRSQADGSFAWPTPDSSA